jgi:SLT domain-containing protein
MSNLTNKVLQEISDLTKNMDVLVKELKSAREEQGKSVDSLNKLTQNLTKSEEQKTKRDEESLSSQEVLFKNLTDSIQKSLEGRDNKLISGLNKSLSLDIEKAFSDFPNKVAQVKSNDTSTKNSFSDIIEQIATKTAEKTPGLKTGGEVTEKGMAVVGEEGPELVDLEKGDKVLSPRQAELMAKRQEVITKSRLDFEKSQEEREARIANETVEQNLDNLSGSTGKDGVINDSGRMKGPTESEIQKYRNSVLQDDADGFYKE